MPTFHLQKDGLNYQVEAETQEEAIAKVKAYAAKQPAPAPESPAEPTPEPTPEQPPEDSLWERVLGRTSDTSADLLAGAASTALEPLDLASGGGIMGFTPPFDPIAALRRQFGVEDSIGVQDLLPEDMRPRDMQFSENPNVAAAMQMIGGVGGPGLASLPTAGAKVAGKQITPAMEFVEGVFGLGMGADDAVRTTQKLTGLAVPKEQADFTDDAWVQEAVSEINVQTAADATRPYMNDYQQADNNYRNAVQAAEKLEGDKKAKALARAEKNRKKAMEAIEAEMGMGDLKHGHSFGDQHVDGVIQTFARMYDIPVAEAAGIVYRSGGVNTPQSFAELAHLHNESLRKSMFESTLDRRGAERSARGLEDTKQSPQVQGYEEWIRPAIGVIRDNVGSGMANRVEAGMVEGMAQRDVLIQKYTSMQNSVTQVAEWADNPSIKRQFMDLHITGVEGRAALIADARKNLNADAFRAFMDMIDDTYENQKNVQKHLLRKDQPRDATHWGIYKLPENVDPTSPAGVKARRDAQRNEKNTVAPLAKRSRKAASKMTDAELAEYDNPIWSNLGQLFDAQDMIALSKSLQIPPSMGIDEGLTDFSDYVARNVRSVTGDDDKATMAGTLINSVIVGSRTMTSDWQRAFMNQAYGQTLGHFTSAALQAHDHFITAMRVGPMDTLRALFSSGVKAQDFGLSTNAFNTREFREGLDAGFMDRMRGEETLGGTAARGSEAYANVMFKGSLFQMMDRWGKGTNLRATQKNMERLIGDPQAFTERYGDFFTRSELAEVRGALTKKTPWEDMSPRQQEIMGRALLGHLGQQQLIGAASRPLVYLDARQGREADLVRPLFAMRGFAIVQADLFKTMVIDRAKAGDMHGAGAAMRKYLGYVGLGYVVADTFRDVVSAGISGGMADAITEGKGHPLDKANAMSNIKPELYPEAILDRAYDSVRGPVTFNLIGDRYSLQRATQKGGAGTIAQQAIPPLGAVEQVWNAGAAGYQAATEPGATPEYVIRKVFTELAPLAPGLGREVKEALKLHEEYDLDREVEAIVRGTKIDPEEIIRAQQEAQRELFR